MFAPWQTQCGIHDYAAHLIDALDTLEEIASVRVVAAPADAARVGLAAALAHRGEDERQFARHGAEMNVAADVAHVQHQYFLFGGVAPHRSHVRAFYDRIEVPLVVTAHEIASETGGLARRIAVRLSNRASFSHRAIRALIVHTTADRERLAAIGVEPRLVRVIRHPVPPALPIPDEAAARDALAALFPLAKDRRVVTLFGFLSNKKGHRVALDAVTRLPPDTALVFAGGRHPDDHTDYVQSLQEQIDRLRLDDRVTITGYLTPEQIAQVMAVTSVAIAPYLQTSGSGSLANLIAYGRAIVASDIPPHREIAAAEPDLLALFPSGNSAALAAEIAALLDDAPRRESLQRSTVDHAARNTYREFARRCADVYRDIL
ncbi:MAG TPA: glycosyltransferase [Chthonomonadaceae bacterium]|nr:glycosyltransferase [Chthonomonadaceae bacterium]